MSTFITKRAREKKFEVRDATKPLILDLQKKDIQRATKKDAGSCAFAQCIKRQEGQVVKRAWFFRTTAWVETEEGLTRYLLPPSMAKELVAFDRGGEMEPGTYQLSAPRGAGTLRAAKKRSQKRRGRHMPKNGTIRRGIIHYTTGIRTLQETGIDE